MVMVARLLSGKKMKKIILFFLIFILLVNNASAYTFTNIGRNFKIEYPTGWTYTEEPDGSDQTFTSQTGHGWVRIAVVSSDGMVLDDIVGERIRYLNSLGIYPFSEKYVTINGVADQVKELMFYENYQQKEYKERQILVLSGDKYYIITAGAATSDYPFYSEDFDNIINSFNVIESSISATTAGAISTPPPATPTPEETDEILSSDVASIALHREKTKVDVGEEVLLKLSIVNYISNPLPMEVQLILAPPSGMSITSTEFTQSTTGQSTSNYTLNPGQNRDIEISLKANEIGNFNVEGRVVYYFGDNKSSAVIKTFKKPITVKSAGVVPVETSTTSPGETSGDSSIIAGIIAIIAIIFTLYVIFNKIAKTFKNKLAKSKVPIEAEVHYAKVEIPQSPEDEPAIEPKIKESGFEVEKRKQHSILPPEDLDIDTRNYLGSGVNTAISTLDAEIAKAESDALEMQGAIRKNEDVLGKLGTRLVNKEIGDQTYNDLKNKYMRKISDLKNKSAALENEEVKLKKIRSFIHEKGKYYA